jgi:hypothetical protein
MFNVFTLEIEFIKNKINLFLFFKYEMIYDRRIVPLNLKTLDFHFSPK